MAVQLGINPLTWTNDDLPSLGAETPLDTCLSEGKEAGFAGFELGNKFPREARLLGPILQRHDLKLVSGWYSGRLLERSVEEEIAAAQAHLTLLRELGAKVMVFAEVSHCIHGEQQTAGSPASAIPAGALGGVWREAYRVRPLYTAAGSADCLSSPYGDGD